MITIFNRRELTATYSSARQAALRIALAAAGVDYRVKVVSRGGASMSRARTGPSAKIPPQSCSTSSMCAKPTGTPRRQFCAVCRPHEMPWRKKQMDIHAYIRSVLNQDAVSMRSFLHENAAVRWHCTNEYFTAEEFIRANCEYPGEWDGEIERIEECGSLIVAALRVFPKDKSASFHCVSFIRMLDDKIIELDEYWADDGPPPEWRIKKRLGRSIRE